MIRLSKGLPKAAQAFPIFFCGFVRIKSQTKNAQRSDPIVQLTDTTDTTDTTHAGISLLHSGTRAAFSPWLCAFDPHPVN